MPVKPLVSIVIPVFNAGTYLDLTLQSVLQQTYENYEVILVDDCSSDGSRERISSYLDPRFRLFINEQNRGIAFSRNRAIAESRGKYIAILDHDDIMLPKRLEHQVEYLEKNTDIDVLGGQSIWIDREGNTVRDAFRMPESPDYIKTSFLFENMYNDSEMMVRRSLLDQYGILYQDGLLGMEDFRFWIDCSKKGRFSNLNEVVLKRRIKGNNETLLTKKRHAGERRKKYMELQEFSLKKSGFELNQEELNVIHRCISEDKENRLFSRETVRLLYSVMTKLIGQAERMDFADGGQVRRYMKERLERSL